MLNQFLQEDIQQPLAQQLSNAYGPFLIKKRKMQTFLLDKKSQYAKYNLIQKPEKEKKIEAALSFYLENYFKGIKDEDYEYVHRRSQFFKEKIISIQEVDHQIQEKKNIFQEKEIIMVKVEESQNSECSKCSSNNSKSYFEVDKKVLCEECAMTEQPEQVSRRKLRLIIKRNEGKGLKYEEKLKKFYEQKIKELKKQNQVILNPHNEEMEN